MTARDEAVEIVTQAAHAWRYGEIAAGVADDELVELSQVLVDTIPGDVLVRLAIERGALEVAMVPGAKFRTFATNEVLLRIVKPGVTP